MSTRSIIQIKNMQDLSKAELIQIIEGTRSTMPRINFWSTLVGAAIFIPTVAFVIESFWHDNNYYIHFGTFVFFITLILILQMISIFSRLDSYEKSRALVELLRREKLLDD